MSLTATHSTSALLVSPARKTLRPMRPKPLIPTRTGMLSILPPSGARSARLRGAGAARRPAAGEGYPTPFVREGCAGRRPRARPSLGERGDLRTVGAGDVAVADLDERVLALAPAPGQVLGDGDGAMAPAGAADGDRQVRRALADVLRQQEVQQRFEVLVERAQLAVAADVVDDPLVVAGQRAQVGLVVRVGQEAHV